MAIDAVVFPFDDNLHDIHNHVSLIDSGSSVLGDLASWKQTPRVKRVHDSTLQRAIIASTLTKNGECTQ